MEPIDILVRLLVAAGLTAVIGIDRELRDKAAGLRTNIVVGTATAAFAFMGQDLISGGQADPTRVAAQVVSGIGFLGGGAIFAAGGKPSGLTTAAALWGSAAVGLAAGIGAFDVAAVLVGVLVVALWPLDRLTQRTLSMRGRHDAHAQVVLRSLADLPAVQAAMAAVDSLRIIDLDLTQVTDQPVVDMRLAGRLSNVREALRRLEAADGVVVVVSSAVIGRDD